MRSEMLSDTTKDFSLVLGGPLYQFLVRVGLVRPPMDRVAGRIVVIALFSWLPLLLLASLGGRLTSGVKIPCGEEIQASSNCAAPNRLATGDKLQFRSTSRRMVKKLRRPANASLPESWS